MANYNSIRGDDKVEADPFAESTEERISMLIFVSTHPGAPVHTKQKHRTTNELPSFLFPGRRFKKLS